VERVYDAAGWWVDLCLRRDGSLFDEARRTVTVETVDGLYAAFVERPDLGKERLLVKLQGQLADQSADVVQLAAELLLPSADRISADHRAPSKSRFVPFVRDHVSRAQPDMAALIRVGGQSPAVGILGRWCIPRL
jgi:hypothetical protein